MPLARPEKSASRLTLSHVFCASPLVHIGQISAVRNHARTVSLSTAGPVESPARVASVRQSRVLCHPVSPDGSTRGQGGGRGAAPPVGGGAAWQRGRGECAVAAAAFSAATPTGEGPATAAATRLQGAASRPTMLLPDGGGAATRDGRSVAVEYSGGARRCDRGGGQRRYTAALPT